MASVGTSFTSLCEANTATMGQAQSVCRSYDAGFDPDIQDHNGRSALHFATKRGLPEIVSLLLRAGASPVLDASGRMPLDMVQSKDSECAQMRTALCTLVKLP